MIIGYVFTLVYVILFAGLVISGLIIRKTLWKKISTDTQPTYFLIALLVIAFFVGFSLLYVSPAEQLYFDENIYQGIALNILHSGSALWCQYGSALLTSCPYSQIYHDPVEISFYLAIAFAIFGIGVQTAYGTSLLIGALSILLVFLLGSSLFGKRVGLASAVVFALIPEVLIWSRTQAIPNLIFMMLATLSFYAYEVYRNNKRSASLAFFLFALGMAVYVRLEAVLLIPIFILIAFYEIVAVNGIKKGIFRVINHGSTKNLAILLLFFAILIPEAYYTFYEAQSMNYGSGYLCGVQTNTTFSLSNFKCNISPNINFFLGAFNTPPFYPAYFSALTTVIALIGAIIMLFKGGKKGVPMMLLGLWVMLFYIFYDAFYAGAVTFGVDVRFMLILYPAIAIFAGFGIATISTNIPNALRFLRSRKNEQKRRLLSWAIFIALMVAFAIVPFYNALNIITISPSKMQQEQMPMSAVNFIYQNVSKVPSNCLVFSFTPDLWWELNRSAAQIGWFNNNNANFTKFESNFTCFVIDKGYWCTTPNYQTGLCSADMKAFNTTIIATQKIHNSVDNFSLYYVDGYKT